MGHAACDCHVRSPYILCYYVRILELTMTDIPYNQDRAPKGGYPEIKWSRNLPRRGPSGLMTILGGVTIMSLGFFVVVQSNKERRWVWLDCLYDLSICNLLGVFEKSNSMQGYLYFH